MHISDNQALENALLYDAYYSAQTRDLDTLSGSHALSDMLFGWFCPRLLSDNTLFPEEAQDRTELLYRTYALGAALAGSTNPDRSEGISGGAVREVFNMFTMESEEDKALAVRRAETVRQYCQTFTDSAAGCEDAVSAMELAYMYMCGIPRDGEHAKKLMEICYSWMYAFSRCEIDRVLAAKANLMK